MMIDYDHFSTVAFGNTRITLWPKNVRVWKLDIWLRSLTWELF